MKFSHRRLSDAADEARHGLDEARKMATEGSRWATAAASDLGDTAQRDWHLVSDRATRQIRDYPLSTVFAAAALGLFTGFLITRR